MATYRGNTNRRIVSRVVRPDLSSAEAFRNDLEDMNRKGELWPANGEALYRALEVTN